MDKYLTCDVFNYNNELIGLSYIVDLGHNKYEHQYPHHYNWMFRYLHDMYKSKCNTHYTTQNIDFIKTVELIYSFPISIDDFVLIAVNIYGIYDYLKTSVKVDRFIKNIIIFHKSIKQMCISLFGVDADLYLEVLKNISNIYDSEYEFINTYNSIKTSYKIIKQYIYLKKNIIETVDKILVDIENYKLNKIKYIRNHYEKSLKHIEYALEECDVVCKLLVYIEKSKIYNTSFDNIVTNLITFNIQKYKYYISTITCPSKQFDIMFECEYKPIHDKIPNTLEDDKIICRDYKTNHINHLLHIYNETLHKH